MASVEKLLVDGSEERARLREIGGAVMDDQRVVSDNIVGGYERGVVEGPRSTRTASTSMESDRQPARDIRYRSMCTSVINNLIGYIWERERQLVRSGGFSAVRSGTWVSLEHLCLSRVVRL